jgi:hypothetical protein
MSLEEKREFINEVLDNYNMKMICIEFTEEQINHIYNLYKNDVVTETEDRVTLD